MQSDNTGNISISSTRSICSSTSSSTSSLKKPTLDPTLDGNKNERIEVVPENENMVNMQLNQVIQVPSSAVNPICSGPVSSDTTDVDMSISPTLEDEQV